LIVVPILRAGDNGKAWGAIAHINKMQASPHVMGGILPVPKFNYVPKALGCMKDMASAISMAIERIEGVVDGDVLMSEADRNKPKNPLAILLERIKVCALWGRTVKLQPVRACLMGRPLTVVISFPYRSVAIGIQRAASSRSWSSTQAALSLEGSCLLLFAFASQRPWGRRFAAQAKFREVTMEFAVKHWQWTLELLAEIKAYRMPPDNMLRIVVALLVSVQSEGLTEYLGEDLLGTNKKLARSYPPKDDPQWTQKLWRYCKNNLHIQGHHPRYIIRLMKATAKGFDGMDISMVREMRKLKEALEVCGKQSRSHGRRLPTKRSFVGPMNASAAPSTPLLQRSISLAKGGD
jgi:hypothetical protein